jgi:restriction endonuclease S subunit
LNSDLGYQQVEQKVHGVGYYSISQSDLGQVEILIPPISFQQQLVNKVSASLTSENQSKHLLEIAKRGVELAIEQDEKAAEAWIQEQIKQLGIELNRSSG